MHALVRGTESLLPAHSRPAGRSRAIKSLDPALLSDSNGPTRRPQRPNTAPFYSVVPVDGPASQPTGTLSPVRAYL